MKKVELLGFLERINILLLVQKRKSRGNPQTQNKTETDRFTNSLFINDRRRRRENNAYLVFSEGARERERGGEGEEMTGDWQTDWKISRVERQKKNHAQYGACHDRPIQLAMHDEMKFLETTFSIHQ